MVVLVTGGENRNRRSGDRAAVFAGDHFGYRLFAAQRRRMQQRLAHAVADCRMQPLAAAHEVVHVLGLRPEFRNVAPAQRICDLAAHIVDVAAGIKSRVAPGNSGENDVCAVAESYLAVFQHEHHRNDRRRLDDMRESRRHRFALVQAAIGNRLAGFYSGQIAMHVPRPPLGTNHFFNFHWCGCSVFLFILVGSHMHSQAAAFMAHCFASPTSDNAA